jgi:hypothetical protein
MSADGSLALGLQVLAGLSLAACCGLRAFLPPFVIGLIARLGAAGLLPVEALPLADSLHWLSSTPALIVFGGATVFELLADKVPVVDHVLDLVQTIVRPLAGALVFAAALSDVSPLTGAIAGLLAGGTVAGGVHVLKAKIRLLSTLGTGGIASPIISTLEDLFALAGSFLAMVAAVLAAILVAGGTLFTLYLVMKFLRRVGRLAPERAAEVQDSSSNLTI